MAALARFLFQQHTHQFVLQMPPEPCTRFVHTPLSPLEKRSVAEERRQDSVPLSLHTTRNTHSRYHNCQSTAAVLHRIWQTSPVTDARACFCRQSAATLLVHEIHRADAPC